MEKENKLEQYRAMLNSGELYDSADAELLAYQHEQVEKLNRYNRTSELPEGLREREKLLRELLASCGESVCLLPPVYANWGLKNVHIGSNVFINFNVCFVDDAEVFIGDDCQIGPGCHILTAQHPVCPVIRKNQLQYNKPVRLERNVWLGAGAIVLPGVTIGENSIVGAGSVVAHDVEPNTIVVGSPARFLRKITEEDNIIYDKTKRIPEEMLKKYGVPTDH